MIAKIILKIIMTSRRFNSSCWAFNFVRFFKNCVHCTLYIEHGICKLVKVPDLTRTQLNRLDIQRFPRTKFPVWLSRDSFSLKIMFKGIVISCDSLLINILSCWIHNSTATSVVQLRMNMRYLGILQKSRFLCI